MATVAPVVDTAAPPRAALSRYVEWGPIVGGAVAASAISFVLLTFGGAVGLSATSAWPDRGLSLPVTFIILAIWVALVQAGSFAAGGYIAGRLRSGWDGQATEAQFRDGAHGFLVWALGILVGAMIAGGTLAGATRTLVEGGSMVAAGATASAARGDRLAVGPADLAVDFLLRPAPGATAPQPGATAPQPGATAPQPGTMMPAPRDAVMRTMTVAIRDGSLAPRERAYLAELVVQRTGLPQADAERRVDEAYAEAKAAEVKVRAAAERARKTAALAGFLAAAALAVGCVAACAGASIGARHRDEGRAARLLFGQRFW